MVRISWAVLIIMISLSLLFSQEAERNKSERNAINNYPLGPIFGNMNINYEHLFDKANGFIVQTLLMEKCGFSTASGFAVDLQYRRHYFRYPKQAGLNSPFWDPFIHYEMNREVIFLRTVPRSGEVFTPCAMVNTGESVQLPQAQVERKELMRCRGEPQRRSTLRPKGMKAGLAAITWEPTRTNVFR